MSDEMLERAIRWAREGNTQEAHEVLDKLVHADVHNVQAWLWYAKTCESSSERRQALETALGYNPESPAIRQILSGPISEPRGPNAAGRGVRQDPSIVNAVQSARISADRSAFRPDEAARPKAKSASASMWILVGSAVLLLTFLAAGGWMAYKYVPKDPSRYRHVGAVEYYLYVPQNYTADRAWPLFVGIHGSGGSGLDCWNWWQSYADREGFILLCPSIADSGGGWYQNAGEEKVFSAINEVRAKYRVSSREFLAGFSAGAQFVQGFAFHYPQYVSGIAVLSSGNYYAPASAARVPMLVVIGDRDDPGAVSTSADFSSTLKQNGYDIEYVVLPGIGHTLTSRGQQLSIDLFRRTQAK